MLNIFLKLLKWVLASILLFLIVSHLYNLILVNQADKAFGDSNYQVFNFSKCRIALGIDKTSPNIDRLRAVNGNNLVFMAEGPNSLMECVYLSSSQNTNVIPNSDIYACASASSFQIFNSNTSCKIDFEKYELIKIEKPASILTGKNVKINDIKCLKSKQSANECSEGVLYIYTDNSTYIINARGYNKADQISSNVLDRVSSGTGSYQNKLYIY